MVMPDTMPTAKEQLSDDIAVVAQHVAASIVEDQLHYAMDGTS